MPSELYPAGLPTDDDDDDLPDLATVIGVNVKNINFHKSASQPQTRQENDQNPLRHFASQPASYTESPLRDINRKDSLSRIRQYKDHHEREMDPKFTENRPRPRPIPKPTGKRSIPNIIDLDLEEDLPSPVSMVGNRSKSFNSIPDPRSSSPLLPPIRPPIQRTNTFPSEQHRPTLRERSPFNPTNIQDFSDDDEALRAAIAASLADMGGPQPSSYHAPPKPPPPQVTQRKTAKPSAFVCPDTLFQSSPSR